MWTATNWKDYEVLTLPAGKSRSGGEITFLSARIRRSSGKHLAATADGKRKTHTITEAQRAVESGNSFICRMSGAFHILWVQVTPSHPRQVVCLRKPTAPDS